MEIGDMFDEVGLELSRDVMDELRVGRQAELMFARQRQKAAHIAGGERRTMAMGEVQMSIDPYYYHFFGRKYGYECWDDPDFVADTIKKNPEVGVRSRTDKIQVGWAPTKPKYHKSYAI